MDPHRNIFFFYRGPIDPANVGIPWDNQLEHNTTKAFINACEFLPPHLAALPFLKLAVADIAEEIERRPLAVCLQRIPEVVLKARHKVPVLLRPEKALQSSDSRTGGRPDAFIYTADGFFAMLIETKTAMVYSNAQLRGHLAAVGWEPDLVWRHVPWEATYRTLKSSGNTFSTEQAFIHSQFLEYLELIGMAPFEGFTEDDFDYFVRPSDDYAPILKGKLMKFGQDVFDALPTRIREVYSEGPYVGRMSRMAERRGLWLAIRGPQESEHPLRQSNFTLELDSEGASINAVIRNGRFDQPRTAIGLLYAALDRQDTALRESLAVGGDFSIRVYERVGPTGGRVLPGGENWFLRGLIRLDHSTNDVFTFLKLMLKAIRLPGIHVRLELHRWDARLHSGEDLRDLAVRTIAQLEPIFDALKGRQM